jgi:dTDP-4-amino-4,6-dideoxygalactose transaminase
VKKPRRLIEHAAAQGVSLRRPVAPCNVHTLIGLKGAYPIADDLMAHLISIPIYPRLTAEESQRVVECVCGLLEQER